MEKGSDLPIEFATITIFNPKDSAVVTGGISNEKGKFRISEIPVGRFFVEIAFIGYETYVNQEVRFNPKSGVEVNLGTQRHRIGRGGIINIVLKKNKLFGYSGNISLTAATGDNYNGSIGLSKRNDKYNIYANYSYRYSDMYMDRETDRSTFFSDTTSVLYQLGGGNRIRENHTLGGGMEFYLSPKSTVFANATYSIRNGLDGDSIIFNTYDVLGDEVLNNLEYIRRNSEDDDGTNIDVKFGFQHVFERRKKVLSLVFSGYGIVGRSFGDLGLQLGMRAEQALTESYLVTTDSLFENDYFSLFPSGHLKYTLPSQKELMLSYSRRINRPRTRQLNPFTDFSNPNLFRVGNAFLLPEYVDAIELSLSKRSKAFQLVTSLYYKKVNDVISRIVTVEGETSTVSYENLASSINKTAQDGSNLENALSNEGYAGNANCNISWRKNKWSVQGSARYRSPFVILQGEISSIFFADLAVKRTILKEKGTIGIRFSDVANTRVFRFSTSGDTFTQSGFRDRESQNLYLTFTYNFGKLEQKKRGSKGRNSGGGGIESDF